MGPDGEAAVVTQDVLVCQLEIVERHPAVFCNDAANRPPEHFERLFMRQEMLVFN